MATGATAPQRDDSGITSRWSTAGDRAHCNRLGAFFRTWVECLEYAERQAIHAKCCWRVRGLSVPIYLEIEPAAARRELERLNTLPLPTEF